MRQFRKVILFIYAAGMCLVLSKPSSAAEDGLYRQLLTDVLHEAEQFSQDKQVSNADLRLFEASWKAMINGKSGALPNFDRSLPWHDLWPPKPLGAAAKIEGDIQKITPPGRPSGLHSISKLDKYLADRLGLAVHDVAKREAAEVLVYAGRTESLARHVANNFDNATVRRIPSLYENWGIEKFLVTRPTARPIIAIKIPPIKHYAQHYQAMFALVSDAVTVVLNQTDREKMRFDYRAKVAELWQGLETKPRRVVLGYSYRWHDVIQEMHEQWQFVVPPRRVSTADHTISASLFQLRSSTNPKQTIDFLALESELTLWGEASAFLMEAVGQQEGLEAIYFLGSAGAPGQLGNVYDVSIPREFSLDGKKIALVNSLNETAVLDQLVNKTKQDLAVLTSAHHTHTNTPAEQTMAYTSALVARGVDTIDVEQSLLAAVIAKLNASGKNIRFGAGNIITDKPGTTHDIWQAEHDLSQIDPARKDLARRKVLALVLEDFKRRDLGIPLGNACHALEAASGL